MLQWLYGWTHTLTGTSQLRFVFLAGLLFPLAGCQFFFPTPIDQQADASTPAAVVRSVGPAFHPGEVIEADVYLDGVVAGTGSMRAMQKCLADGKPAIPVRTEASSGGLLSLFGDASASAWGLVDADTNSPLESVFDIEMDEKRTVAELDFMVGGYRLHQTKTEPDKKPKEVFKRVELPIEQVPHDSHSVIGYLRNWEPPEGTRGYLYMLVGRSLWRLDVMYVGDEKLVSAGRPVSASRIDGVASRISEKSLKPSTRIQPRPFTMWISDDERRAPIRILVESDVAKVTVELSRYTKTDLGDGAMKPCADRVDKKALARAKKPKKKPPVEESKVADADKEDDDEKLAPNLPGNLRVRLLKMKKEAASEDAPDSEKEAPQSPAQP
jgi:hypothetical protein